MKTYLFPGQGSQQKGMGNELFDLFPDMTKQADSILGYSIKDLCLNNPEQKLNQTQYTQPAMYVVNAMSYLKKVGDTRIKPDFVAGHSLGEYNALHASEVFSFETGLKLVKKRGELMSKAVNGGMAAILNCPEMNIREILEKANLSTIDIANLNAPSQIVISGLREDIEKAQSFFEKEEVKFIPLNTSGAFHSRYMKEAGTDFAKFIKRFKLSGPKITVISNVTAQPYEQEGTAKKIVDQITNPVRWSDSIIFLLNQGEMEFEEMGVGDVLTKLVVHIRKAWNAENVAISVDSGVECSPASEEAEPNRETEKPASWDRESLNAQEMVERWNKGYPVGTRVRVCSDLYDTELETRTEAMILFGHRAAVYMKGYNGYFDLREVMPA